MFSALIIGGIVGVVVGFIAGARVGFNTAVAQQQEVAGASKVEKTNTEAKPVKLPVKSESDTTKPAVAAKVAPKKRGRPAKKLVAPAAGKKIKKGSKNR